MKKASMTVYLSLTLCVILSLIFACMDSVRLSCGRSAVSCAMDESMFSLFSNYDRTLFDEYGLMFLDGGYGGEAFQAGRMMEELKENMTKVLAPATGIFGTSPQKLYRISVDSAAVTGYVLATDEDYLPIREQICSFMWAKIGIDGVKRLADMVTNDSEIIQQGEWTGGSIDLSGMLGDLSDVQTPALTGETTALNGQETPAAVPALYRTANGSDSENAGVPAGAETAKLPDGGVTAGVPAAKLLDGDVPAVQGSGEVEIPEDFVNPLDHMQSILGMGLYNLILPAGKTLSETPVGEKKLAGHRKLRTGLNLTPNATERDWEKLLLNEYALDFFSNYVNETEGRDLKYQTEYVIAGHDNDQKNLRGVLDRLVLIRMGLNYMHLMTSTLQKAEAAVLALIISCVILNPEAEPVIEQIIMLVWSYIESMTDLKTLLSGEKVPLMKSDSSWKTDINMLGTFGADTPPAIWEIGLTYEDYLRVLLFMTPKEDVIHRLADMLEYNRRQEDGMENFCLDNCITALEVEFSGRIAKHPFTITRSYGYDMESE